MAMQLMRRALSNRHTTVATTSLINGANTLQTRDFSHVLTSRTPNDQIKPPSRTHFEFPKLSSRGFAKGKRSKDDSAAGSVDVVADIGPSVKEAATSQMDAAIVALSRELAKLRTGRASPGMLDHIIVETGGVKMPLVRLAVVSVLDPKTLSVNPYDPNTLKEIESAIVSSPLGLNPRNDGQRLIATIPPLTKEHMQAMCKIVSKSCEEVKQSIRRARQKALDTFKKAGSHFPKDSAKRLEKEVDELTKKFVKSAEDMCKAKEKEISSG